MRKANGFFKFTALILLLMLLLSVSMPSVLAAGGDIDLVIVLDDSGSMYPGTYANDVDAYRFDAASIMLNMCNAEGSRAAVLTFATDTEQLPIYLSNGKEYSRELYKFLDYESNQKKIDAGKEPIYRTEIPLGSLSLIGQYNNRALLSDKLITKVDTAKSAKDKNIGGRTNLGAAMHWAIDILDQGTADRGDRQPMILVLADGNCDDPEALDKALKLCIEKEYKVYTILLHNEHTPIDYSDPRTAKFMSMSTLTGALPTFEPKDATELPNIFTEIFADQIGSEVTPMELTPKFDVSTQTYTISIPIPNRSVAEANIMMPTSNGHITGIQLRKPKGELATEDQSLFYFDTYYFKQYKLLDPTTPDKLGIWKLSYKKDDKAQDEVSVNIVFSYNIELEGSISTDPTNGSIYNKGDKVDLKAVFVDDKDIPSSDELLYRGVSAEDEGAIRCFVKLLPKGEINDAAIEKATSIELDPDKVNRCFYANAVSARDFGIERAGEYEFVFYAEGDGLVREALRVPYTLINQTPAGNAPKPVELKIDDPTADDLNQQDSEEIDFSAFVSDPDGDPMTMTVQCDDPSVIRVEDENAEDVIFTIHSQGKPGSTEIKATFNDHDTNGKADFTFKVDVVSVKDSLVAEYEPRITITDPAVKENGVYENGATLKFAVTIETKNGVQNPHYNIEDYEPEVTLCWVGGETTGRDLPITLAKDPVRKLCWLGEFELPNDENHSSFDFHAELKAGNDVSINIAEETAKVSNQAPRAYTETIDVEADVEPFTLFEKKLGKDSTEPWSVAYADLFYDNDVNDKLTYSYEVIAGGDCADIIELDDESGIQISPEVKGKLEIKLTAEDPSKESAECTYCVTMISLNDTAWAQIKHYSMIAAAALVLLVILYFIARPRLNGLNLKIQINGMAQESWPLNRFSKTAAKLSSFTTTEQKSDNLHNLLATVVIKPCWLQTKRRVKVCWKNKGRLPASLTVGNKSVKSKKGKKQLILNLNDTIMVTVKEQKHAWRLEQASVGKTKSARGKISHPAPAKRPSGPSPYDI